MESLPGNLVYNMVWTVIIPEFTFVVVLWRSGLLTSYNNVYHGVLTVRVRGGWVGGGIFK